VAPPWVTIQSSQNVKMEGGEDEVRLPHQEDLNFHGHITTYQHIYKNVIMLLRITKMSL